jgi:hypothetical protein
MKEKEYDLERENIAHLIGTSYSSDARPHPQTREQIYRILFAHSLKRFAVVEFPDAAVGALGIILVLVTAYVIFQLMAGTSFATHPTFLLLATWLVLNLLVLPAAGMVIVIRRHNG